MGFEETLDEQVLHSLEKTKYYMRKIRITETGIKKLDPSFVSPNPVQ
jgi:hypothetical protein